MNANRLTSTQQWVLLGVVALVLLMPYGIKRFWPKYQVIEQSQLQLTQNLETIKMPNYPESPSMDENDILDEIDELQATVDALNSQTDTLQGRIPSLESQDILLELSAAARVNNVTVVDNVPYLVPSKQSDGNQAANNPVVLDQDTRRALRESKSANVSISSGKAVTGPMPREGELIYDVTNKLAQPRPLQLMTLQGTYFGLMGFIQAVRNLPVQVTILNINIDTEMQLMPQNTQNQQNQQNMQGLPQLLRVSLIVAL